MSIRSNVDARGLNERVTLQRRSVSQDPTTGDPTTTWSDLITCWARVDGVKASDRWKEPHLADATQGVTDLTIWVRADIVQRFSVVESDRVIWGARVLDVVDVLDQQLRGRLTALVCRLGLSNG
jgi:SPP1 family predicted phage head-tail adaptor